MATMLTEGALFFFNLCNDYRDIRRAKATSGVSDAWLRQEKSTISIRRRLPEDSDDETTASKPSSTTANRPSKKRIIDSGVAVVAHAQALPSKQSRKASTSGDAEKVHDEEPMDVYSCHYGGLEDEDDEEEWEAIKQSPAKQQGVRISDHVRCHSSRLPTPC
jgi:hypothetical protein